MAVQRSKLVHWERKRTMMVQLVLSRSEPIRRNQRLRPISALAWNVHQYRFLWSPRQKTNKTGPHSFNARN